jgi:RNA polymerase sigma-70 factor (ECF subfamily)
MMTPEQEHLFIQQVPHDPQAFKPIYEQYFPRVHAYIRYRVSNSQDAEDIVSDVFFKAIRELGRFKWRGDGSFAGWLFRIAHNLIVDYFRKNKHAGQPSTSNDNLVALSGHSPLPEEIVTQQETFQQMRALIALLSPRRQEIITLRFFGGLRNLEIARILRLDERTVAAHLSRGLQDLRREYLSHTQSELMGDTV